MSNFNFYKRSFPKLRFSKNYLRSTQLQERLSGLVIFPIEKEILENYEYKNLIRNFAFQKT